MLLFVLLAVVLLVFFMNSFSCRMSGWSKMKKDFHAASAQAPDHPKWKGYLLESGSRGPEPLGLYVLESGIYLEPPMWRFQWEPLLVPWNEIKYRQPVRSPWFKATHEFKLAGSMTISVEEAGYREICKQVGNLMQDRKGTISGLYAGAHKGDPKQTREQLKLIATFGVEGDIHAGLQHDRQISLFSQDVFDELVREGFDITAEQFSANLFLANFPVDSLPLGTQLQVGAVRLEISEVRNPCRSLTQVDIRLPRRLYGQCGQFARVITDGTVNLNDAVTLIPATLTRSTNGNLR
ncbi:MAG: hypothetical protein HOP19_24370 [Acidobacteria bacterium]|nr:hypothetical protein [Acidobacteriota bacterium]